MVRHIVLISFTDRDDAPEAKHRLEALPAEVPEIASLEVVLDALRAPGAYDLALTTTHTSPQTLAAYQDHPVHQAFLQWLRPRLAARAVVDAEV